MNSQKKLSVWSLYTEFVASVIYSAIATGVVSSTGILTFGELLAPRLVVVALGNGFGYAIALYMTVRATGAGIGYLNPVVTLAMMCANPYMRRYEWPGSKWPGLTRGACLMLAQFFGAGIGIGLILLIVPNADKSNETLGVPEMSYGTSTGSALAIEGLGSFFLTWVILANESHTALGPRSASTPLAAGLAMTAMQLIAFPFTTACFHPFRAFWLFVFSETYNWDSVAFYMGPILGACLATVLYMLAFTNCDVLQTSKRQ